MLVELLINGKNPRASEIKLDGEQVFDIHRIEFSIDADKGMPLLILHRYFDTIKLTGELNEVED